MSAIYFVGKTNGIKDDEKIVKKYAKKLKEIFLSMLLKVKSDEIHHLTF